MNGHRAAVFIASSRYLSESDHRDGLELNHAQKFSKSKTLIGSLSDRQRESPQVPLTLKPCGKKCGNNFARDAEKA